MENGEKNYQRFLDGDDQGLAALINEYKDGLILYINSYVNNIYVAEDLTEDTFFRIMTKKPHFSGKSSFKSWLYAIARHIAVDHIRHFWRISTVPEEETENYLIDEQSLEKSYIREESKLQIHKVLSTLKYEYRTIIWLIYFEEFSNKEVALILNKNEGHIRTLLHRAKMSLKEKLLKEGFSYEEWG